MSATKSSSVPSNVQDPQEQREDDVVLLSAQDESKSDPDALWSKAKAIKELDRVMPFLKNLAVYVQNNMFSKFFMLIGTFISVADRLGIELDSDIFMNINSDKVVSVTVVDILVNLKGFFNEEELQTVIGIAVPPNESGIEMCNLENDQDQFDKCGFELPPTISLAWDNTKRFYTFKTGARLDNGNMKIYCLCGKDVSQWKSKWTTKSGNNLMLGCAAGQSVKDQTVCKAANFSIKWESVCSSERSAFARMFDRDDMKNMQMYFPYCKCQDVMAVPIPTCKFILTHETVSIGCGVKGCGAVSLVYTLTGADNTNFMKWRDWSKDVFRMSLKRKAADDVLTQKAKMLN